VKARLGRPEPEKAKEELAKARPEPAKTDGFCQEPAKAD
jgi:hypothetical protein